MSGNHDEGVYGSMRRPRHLQNLAKLGRQHTVIDRAGLTTMELSA
jgi:hypothetical protein